MSIPTRLDPATSYVRSLDGGPYYMIREAAEMLGVHHRVLRKLNMDDQEDQDLKPSFLAFLGKVKIYLYTEDDLVSLREHLQERRRVYPNEPGMAPLGKGRPRTYPEDDRKERQKLFSKAYYYGKRAEEETNKGNLKKATEYLAMQRQVKKELRNWPKTGQPSALPTKSPSTETEAGSSLNTAPTLEEASQT